MYMYMYIYIYIIVLRAMSVVKYFVMALSHESEEVWGGYDLQNIVSFIGLFCKRDL